MAGRSISAYIDDETAASLDEITRATGVKKANFSGRAIKFYAALSEEARRALAGIDNLGQPQDRQFVAREVTRVLALAHMRILQRKMAASLKPEMLGDGSDAALAAATDLALRA